MKITFATLSGFLVFFTGFSQVHMLDDLLLSYVPILREAEGIVLADYKALVQSARHEIASMIKNKHAQIISRIGFISEEMMEVQREVYAAIANRRLEIGNAACLEEAETEFNASVTSAGEFVMHSAGQWKILNDALIEINTFRAVDEIDLLISIFEIELLNLFVHFNSVTDFYWLLYAYEYEIQVFFYLFDYFVDLVIYDMTVHENAVQQFNYIQFTTLQYGANNLRSSGNSIISSLGNCHA